MYIFRTIVPESAADVMRRLAEQNRPRPTHDGWGNRIVYSDDPPRRLERQHHAPAHDDEAEQIDEMLRERAAARRRMASKETATISAKGVVIQRGPGWLSIRGGLGAKMGQHIFRMHRKGASDADIIASLPDPRDRAPKERFITTTATVAIVD
jgi:hypothetical protein